MSERSPSELLEQRQRLLDEMNDDGLGEPRSALDYLQDIYKGRRQADPWRFRAAKEALPFESPKLAVTTNISNESFAAMLDRAIARSQAPPKMIEHRPNETKAPPQWSGPMARAERQREE
jgi:hypothetical protein